MKRWQDVLISPSTPIMETIKVITENALQIALVVDDHGHLLGTVTDGDIRRGILKTISLDNPVSLVMNMVPSVASLNNSRDEILAIMRQNNIKQLPLIDDRGIVTGLEILDVLIRPKEHKNWVVIMAGGTGSRLRPLTNDCPKPLLHVGSKPILETILDNFIEYGFKHFYLSVNYKAEMVQKYFGDGSKWGVKIHYIQEDQPMGTAGPLGLLPERPTLPVVVMNGDLLTKVNFRQLLDFHMDHRAKATVCVREYDFQVPYGVVTMDKYKLKGIEEKPVHRFFVNAGIYVLEPETIDLIDSDVRFDMTELLQKCIRDDYETAAFPIREYWMDIGKLDDFEQANNDYAGTFE